jgi:ABC-2 type transport system ATP-binding protein
MLHVEDVSKDFGDHVALDSVSFDAEPGELVAVVGPNGAGKSTLLRIIAGLMEPTGGSVTIGGNAPGSVEARRSVSFVPDNPVLYDDLSVIEHLEYVARLHDFDDWEERGAYLLERLGLDDRSEDLPARFSRGLRQKTSLCLGLVRPLDLLLVDEPFVGLDARGKSALLELLDQTASDGATVIVSTHELSFVERAVRCVALRDGSVVENRKLSVDDVSALLA